MANHLSAKKRIRQNAVRRLRNQYKVKSARTLIKKLRSEDEKANAEKLLPKVISKIDLCVKHNIYHTNKASRLKSRLTRHVNSL